MSRITNLHINNFKFFNEQKPIKLNGKHLLLYGENGSGKSSIYWALYTLFECAIKSNVEDIKKYFEDSETKNESLVNIYAPKVTDVGGLVHYNSFIDIATNQIPDKSFHVSFKDQAISGDREAVLVNQSSDFINYKVLYKLQDFWNGKPMDLANIFLGYVLNYVQFTPAVIRRAGVDHTVSNAYAMWLEIEKGPGYTTNGKGKKILVYKHSEDYERFQAFVTSFNSSFKRLVEFININAPKLLSKLGYDIGFELQYHEASFEKKDVVYNAKLFGIGFKITSYLGRKVNIHRPQSFLNEAKMTAISLAIRLTILQQRVNREAGDILKFIVFDDVMISLDMNNRDMLMDFLLSKDNKFTDDYQLLFLTHDKNFFNFALSKIKQLDSMENWVIHEMYVGQNKKEQKEFPVLIDSSLDYTTKARKYFAARDYTSCALYIRKELEKLIIERLPLEFTRVIENQYHNLAHLWKLCCERYDRLGKAITDPIRNSFEQTKLMLLNPQAHHNLSFPVYTLELEKAFTLIKEIEDDFPIPDAKIVLSEGMILEFKHPRVDYSMKFELLDDLYTDGLGAAVSLIVPKCRILNWSYNGIEFWDFKTNAGIVLKKPIEHSLKQIKDTLTGNTQVPLDITEEMFLKNTILKNGYGSLNDILTSAGVTIP